MGFIELFFTSVGLSMDAFAVSVCKGLSSPRVRAKQMVCAGLWFGGFQALMPLIGYFFGSAFKDYIENFDHWIAFILMCFIGGKMVLESFSEEESNENGSFSAKTMFVMAVATSIDALAVGITFAVIRDTDFQIIPAVLFIGVITFVFSALGIKIGNTVGCKHKNFAELAGGVILIIIGIKILLEHLGVITF